MTDYAVRLPVLHAEQRRARGEARRFNVLACGRRWGKTMFGCYLLALAALQKDPYPVAWFAPSYKLLLEPWDTLLRWLAPVVRRSSATDRRIELITGAVIDFWTLDDVNAGRGRKYSLIVVDEAALIRHLGEAWPAALRPTLTDYEGAAWFFSTPKGKGYFWQLYESARTDEAWTCRQAPSHDNPHLPRAELDLMRETLPGRIYEQEILAVFSDDAGGVFRGVVQAATATPQHAPVPGHEYIMGVDWGKQNDFTVFTVLDATLGELVWYDRMRKIDYTLQMGRLEAANHLWKPLDIIIERNAMGEPLIEQAAALGLPVTPFTTTNASKKLAIESLALAIETQVLTILADPDVIAEHQAYEATRLASGLFRYSAPPGFHDDIVMSLALAYHGASLPEIQLVY